MTAKLQMAGLSSTIVESQYEKLRELSFQEAEDSDEYKEIVGKLKDLTKKETEIYEELTNEDIVYALNSLKVSNERSIIKRRIHNKLQEIYRRRTNPPKTTDISNVISTKIMIDVLKSQKEKLENLVKTTVSPEARTELITYSNVYKYNYLTGNSFIEELAIKANFNIDELPTFTFEDIEKEFKLPFVSESTELFLSYIKESIQELLNTKTNDEYLNVHIALFEVSRVEVMLPYLPKNELESLISYINKINVRDENIALRKIRKLIKKRKEELE